MVNVTEFHGGVHHLPMEADILRSAQVDCGS